jgi:hypothetical protein
VAYPCRVALETLSHAWSQFLPEYLLCSVILFTCLNYQARSLRAGVEASFLCLQCLNAGHAVRQKAGAHC